MKMKNILLISIILIAFSGCRTGPATYKVFKTNTDLGIGKKLYSGLNGRDKVYDKNHYIYILEYPKNCIYGYLVKKNDKKKIIVDWVIISGKEFCKERQATVLIQ